MPTSRIRGICGQIPGNFLRSGVLVVGLVAAAASAGSSRNTAQPNQPAADGNEQPPESRPMDANLAIGLWKSNFGPIKMQFNDQQPGTVMGVWVYDRQGQEIIGFFNGSLSGNVLSFNWDEPAQPLPLRGAGYLVFDPQGRVFSGRWWTNDRSRSGAWNGWRTEETTPQAPGEDSASEAPEDGISDGMPREGGPAEQAPTPPPSGSPNSGGYL